jgi:general secretion pathway protein G
MSFSKDTVRGFTLIELIVSLAILGLIATMVAPIGEVVVKREKSKNLEGLFRQIEMLLITIRQLMIVVICLKK